MTLNDALKLPSLALSEVMAGRSFLDREITGVMVLEALDVEKWSRPGEMILTSYFALQGLDEKELEEFIKKLCGCGISALAVKPERLLADIPACLIRFCEAFGLPLLRIPKDTKYETIILDILSPIINANAALLDKHYSIHQRLMKFALKEPSLDEILLELKRLISYDVSIFNPAKGMFVSTIPVEGSIRVIGKWPLPQTKYMNFTYFHNRILLGSSPVLASAELSSAEWTGVSIPNVENEDLELLIHNNGKALTNDDFMTVENFVFFLQILKLIQKLNREYGITIVMVLHDINQSLYYSDEIVAMKDGRMIAHGLPEEIITKELVKELYGVDLTIQSVDGKPFVIPV